MQSTPALTSPGPYAKLEFLDFKLLGILKLFITVFSPQGLGPTVQDAHILLSMQITATPFGIYSNTLESSFSDVPSAELRRQRHLGVDTIPSSPYDSPSLGEYHLYRQTIR